MGKINWGRVIGGGLVAGLVGNVLEALHGFLMETADDLRERISSIRRRPRRTGKKL